MMINNNYNGDTFRNGDKIPNAKSVEEFIEHGKKRLACIFVDQELNQTFYNFFAVEDTRRFAPDGYKVASPDDWNGIIYESGISDIDDAGMDEYDCLEEDYVNDNQDLSNLESNIENFESENKKNNLNIIPSGFISKWEGRVGVNKQARFWTSKERDTDDAFWVGLNSEYIFLGAYDHVKKTFSSKQEGLQVRLVKEK